MHRTDLVTGGLFLAGGLALAVSGMAFPPGVGNLPGAGFFPQAIGGVMALLAIALLWRGRRREGESVSIANPRHVLGVAALLFVYLLTWNSGLFPVRTLAFLLATLRFLGQSWKQSAAYGTALTAFVYLAFDAGLNVSLE